MSALAKHLLELTQEFAARTEDAGVANEFGRPDWKPRSEDEIADEYDATLRALIAE